MSPGEWFNDSRQWNLGQSERGTRGASPAHTYSSSIMYLGRETQK